MKKNVPEKCYDKAAIKAFLARMPAQEEMLKMPQEDLRKLCLEIFKLLPPEDQRDVMDLVERRIAQRHAGEGSEKEEYP